MTDQQLKLKFFGLHLGCPFIRGGSRGTLQGVSIDRFGKECAQTVFDGLIATIKIDNCRLLLKPLSEITDEDAYEVGKLVNCWSKAERNMKFFIDDELRDTHIAAGKMFANAIGKDFGHASSHPFANNSTEILSAFDYLRSKGYCLPYMWKDPFKEGWAIPATVNQPSGANQQQ